MLCYWEIQLNVIAFAALHLCTYTKPTWAASAGLYNFNGEHNALQQEQQQLVSYAGDTKPRNRRMYALCPPQFQRIGFDCYSLPSEHSSWLEAHFYCKDKNAKLAEPQKYADRKLRKFLHQNDAQYGSKLELFEEF